jgi:hypothetical protein
MVFISVLAIHYFYFIFDEATIVLLLLWSES